MTRAPCKKRNGEAVPRVEKIGDLMTADHKVLSEVGESRNNHRHGEPKVTNTDNPIEFVKSCEDLSWNLCTSTPCRSDTNGIAERAVRTMEEGTSALLQSGLDEKMVR